VLPDLTRGYREGKERFKRGIGYDLEDRGVANVDLQTADRSSYRIERESRGAILPSNLPNSVQGRAISISSPIRRAERLRSLPLLPGVVPAEVLCLNFAARLLHHFGPWLSDPAGFMLYFNLILVAGFAGAGVAQSALRRYAQSRAPMRRGAAVSGLITAAILGPVWWNVYTFGEASVWPALPFIYGSVLTLLVGSLWRAYWRRSFPNC
jgi:hypothetical protein